MDAYYRHAQNHMANKDLKNIKNLQEIIYIIENNLAILDNNIILVNTVLDGCYDKKAKLENNLRFLKKDKVITIASEYKKISQKLDKVNKTIMVYEQSKEDYIRSNKQEKTTYNKIMGELKKQKDLIKNKKIVLFFDQKKRKNKNARKRQK